MGKKNREEMDAQREKFLAGCSVNKVPPKKAERLFDLIFEFSGYGFNKSHSCAYALLAYQTAWLKTHYPVEFMTALLTSETGNTEKVVKYIHEARGMGITVLPPDVNSSELNFTPVGEAIRFGLQAIKNVGENTVLGILDSRARLGGFRSIFQFCESVDFKLLNRRVLESLIKSGAMDSFGARRSQLHEMIDRAMERGQKLQREQAGGQSGLFSGAGPAAPPPEPSLPEIDEWPEETLLDAELATVGFFISGHPLAKHSARLKELGAIDLASIEGRRNGEEVTVAGLVMSLRPMRSRKGDRWAIVGLQDISGGLEVLVFPEALGRLEGVLKSGAPLLLRGRVNAEDAGTRIAVQDAKPLDRLSGSESGLMRVRVALNSMDEYTLDELKKVFASAAGPSPIVFDLEYSDGSVATLRSNQRVRLDDKLIDDVRKWCGPDAVQVIR
jgi:DNA polymerase-3 subunit alpha